MFVCICNAVTDTEIQEAIEEGCDDLYAIGMKLGAGMACGSCAYVVQEIIDEHKSDTSDDLECVQIYKP